MIRRIKAAFWLSYMETEYPRLVAEILRSMPNDDDIDLLLDLYGVVFKGPLDPCEWGNGVVQEEFHHQIRYPFPMD